MSELDLTRLYNWMCEHADERLAEYLMASLAPVPIADLVTNDHLTAELSRFATKDDLNTGLNWLHNEMATQRAEDRAAMAAQRDEDRAERAAQRDEDRRAALHRHYWLLGTIVSVGLSIGVQVWL